MIRNFDDLLAYTGTLAAASPEIAAETRIVRPGCAPHVIAALERALPGLPESYLSVLASLAIDGIVIGYFELTPSSALARNLVDKLQMFNDPDQAPMARYYRRYEVYHVASWEADPVCVAHADGTFRLGQIVKFNEADPTTPPILLADGFEEFLLVAANLDEIRALHVNRPARAADEFKAYLAPLVAHRQDDMLSAWIKIASVVLA